MRNSTRRSVCVGNRINIIDCRRNQTRCLCFVGATSLWPTSLLASLLCVLVGCSNFSIIHVTISLHFISFLPRSSQVDRLLTNQTNATSHQATYRQDHAPIFLLSHAIQHPRCDSPSSSHLQAVCRPRRKRQTDRCGSCLHPDDRFHPSPEDQAHHRH